MVSAPSCTPPAPVWTRAGGEMLSVSGDVLGHDCLFRECWSSWRMFENADHVKLLLELLIGVIDAELLEAVHLERLKPGHNTMYIFCNCIFVINKVRRWNNSSSPTHRCLGHRWTSAVWRKCSGLCWPGRRSRRRAWRKCVSRERHGRSRPPIG